MPEQDTDPIETVVERNPEAVEDYLNGEDGGLNFLVGKVMQETHGGMDPGVAKEELVDAINDQWEQPIDWPVEIESYRVVDDQDAIAEKLWNHLRDRAAPIPKDPDTPNRLEEPRIRCKYLLHEDGSTEIVEVEGR